MSTAAAGAQLQLNFTVASTQQQLITTAHHPTYLRKTCKELEKLYSTKWNLISFHRMKLNFIYLCIKFTLFFNLKTNFCNCHLCFQRKNFSSVFQWQNLTGKMATIPWTDTKHCSWTRNSYLSWTDNSYWSGRWTTSNIVNDKHKVTTMPEVLYLLTKPTQFYPILQDRFY
jgi:hypothetical protein